MLMDEIVEAFVTEFKQNVALFFAGRDCSRLTPELAQTFSKELLASMAQGGVAALGAFLQSYEQESDAVEVHDEVYRFKAVRIKEFLTVFGVLRLARRCFQNASDTKSHVPIDAAWGMEKQTMTPDLREAVLFSSALVTPEETVQILDKCALFTPHATTIKHAIAKTGQKIEAEREALDKAIRAREQAPGETQTVVVSVDGATVLMNEKGVHFGRRAERPRGRDPEQTPSAYRVAMAGSISYYGAPGGPEKRPERLGSHYVGRMPERGCPTFKTHLEAEVDDMESKVHKGAARILLLDGARELWNYFDKNKRYDGYHRCIDYWHAVEHLSVAAEALFGSGPEAKRWFDRYRRVLREKDDGPTRVRRSMKYYDQALKRNKTRQKHLDEQRTYFRRNEKRMPYAKFENNGWPIGSGPIEAACKTLIKARLCRSGMRWKRPGGQNILNLRTYVKSGRWDTAWKYIKQMDYAES